jgi:hypothetical protein
VSSGTVLDAELLLWLRAAPRPLGSLSAAFHHAERAPRVTGGLMAESPTIRKLQNVLGVDIGILATQFMRARKTRKRGEGLFPPLRAGDTRRGALYTDLARNGRLARAYGSLQPRKDRQRGRMARSRRFGVPTSPTCAPGNPAAGFYDPTPAIPACMIGSVTAL